MQIRRHFKAIWWCLPLSLYSLDANAWGLYTHVYFAQSLLFAVPLLDKRFRDIIKQFPELVMAGACLPDLAIISKKFNTTHQWKKAEYLMNAASTPEEIAVAIGYASHLYVDVIAHNHFVPAHEALWLNESVFTHIASEWAMDVHIESVLLAKPRYLLTKHATLISHFIAPCFQQPQKFVKQKLITLAYADRLLRMVKLPTLIHRFIRLRNNEKHKHFDYYISKTTNALHEFHKVLKGHRPGWEPELPVIDDLKHMMTWRKSCLDALNKGHAVPISYYKA